MTRLYRSVYLYNPSDTTKENTLSCLRLHVSTSGSHHQTSLRVETCSLTQDNVFSLVVSDYTNTLKASSLHNGMDSIKTVPFFQMGPHTEDDTITTRSPHDHHMITWSPYDHHMITTRSPCDHHRSPYDHHTISIRSPHDYHTMTTRSPHDHQRSPHDLHTISIRSPYDLHTITTWPPHDRHTITTRSPYDHHTISIRSPHNHHTITTKSPYDHHTITIRSTHNHHTITTRSPYDHHGPMQCHYDSEWIFVYPSVLVHHVCLSVCLSVCPYVRLSAWSNSVTTGRNFMKCEFEYFSKKGWYNSKRRAGTLNEERHTYIFYHISLNFSQKEKFFKQMYYVAEKIKTQFYVKFLFSKIVTLMKLCGEM
jgi:hypothetical protein